jgi:SAM-dependent MidA family methyltransferase
MFLPVNPKISSANSKHQIAVSNEIFDTVPLSAFSIRLPSGGGVGFGATDAARIGPTHRHTQQVLCHTQSFVASAGVSGRVWARQVDRLDPQAVRRGR